MGFQQGITEQDPEETFIYIYTVIENRSQYMFDRF